MNFAFFLFLQVKVDMKTKAILDEYKKKKRHELAKKAANDTTAFKFVYEEEEEDDENNEANKPIDSKVRSILTFHPFS